ncbi:MAG: hypothetical protein F6K11_16465 [Leptolyngbya sp. SIO3F4]|nr:hypothetical protein [Leptolyngbya sp. SIO3F4]
MAKSTQQTTQNSSQTHHGPQTLWTALKTDQQAATKGGFSFPGYPNPGAGKYCTPYNQTSYR